MSVTPRLYFPQETATVLTALRRSNQKVATVDAEGEPATADLVSGEERLITMQLGFSIHAITGEDLTVGGSPWERSWLVIGMNYYVGDPYFVDLAQPEFPVFTAMHGAGVWRPVQVAPSLAAFLA